MPSVCGHKSLSLTLTLCLLGLAALTIGQPLTDDGILKPVAGYLEFPCEGEQDLWCWSCNANSYDECHNKGMYVRCESTKEGTFPICQREVDRNADNQVTRVRFQCQADVPYDPSQEPCLNKRGEEQCQHYLGVDRCKICTFGDVDNTPRDVFPMSACGLEDPPNPCDDYKTLNGTVCERSLEPAPHPIAKHTRMRALSSLQGLSDEEANEETDLWCWECHHSMSEERCLAEGRHQRCKDKLGQDEDPICIREVRTNAAGRTTITRRCGRRDRCDPRMMTLEGDGVCADDPDKGGVVCKTCNFGDPDNAAVYGGFSVYRCHTTSHLDCVCRGDPHCFSLAGTPLPLMGNCEYLFARDRCWMGVPESQEPRFKVTGTMATNPAGTRSWVTSVTLCIPLRKQVITIGQGRSVTYNGLILTPEQMPFIAEDEDAKVIIANGTQFVHVYSMDPPVHVLYNGERSMQINVPRWMSGQSNPPGPSQLCGVCGPGLDASRDQIAGPNTMQCSGSGRIGQKASSPAELLHSWTTGIISSQCSSECSAG